MDDNKVKQLFESIAFSYDFQNSFLSLGQDIFWRRALARSIRVPREGIVLDLATGTAELAMEICAHHPSMKVVGLDFSQRMLGIGRRKIQAKGLWRRIDLNLGDARRLPFRTQSFDAATMAFGIRNIGERKEVLREIFRVLKRGGRLWIMEFDCPDHPVLGRLYRFYFDRILPPLGNWISRTDCAYTHLVRSVHQFPSENEFAQEIADVGFELLGVKKLSMGVAKIYLAAKTSSSPASATSLLLSNDPLCTVDKSKRRP